jgi:hypothetical protein
MVPQNRRVNMSLEIQTILLGHHNAEAIKNCLSGLANAATVAVRSMQKPDYKLLEGVLGSGHEFAINAFLNSYAVEDHAEVFNGPSTFLTVQYDPALIPLMEAVALEFGGFIRVPSSPEWKPIAGNRNS